MKQNILIVIFLLSSIHNAQFPPMWALRNREVQEVPSVISHFSVTELTSESNRVPEWHVKAKSNHSLFTLSLMQSARERDNSETCSGSYCTPDNRSLTISRMHSFTTAGLNLQDSAGSNKEGQKCEITAVCQQLTSTLSLFNKSYKGNRQ